MAESGKQKKQHQQKSGHPRPYNPEEKKLPPVAKPLEELFPPILSFPWEDEDPDLTEEKIPENSVKGKGKQEVLTVDTFNEGYNFEGRSKESFDGEIGAELKPESKVAAFRTGFPMEPADVVRGFIWSEILQPPKSKRMAYRPYSR